MCVRCFRFLDFHVSIHAGGPVHHDLDLHQLHLLWPFQVPQPTQLWGERVLVRANAVAPLSPLTLSPRIVCVHSQVKEEDEDTAKEAEENTKVLYLFHNEFHIKDQTYWGQSWS